jgi:hypothetical protein
VVEDRPMPHWNGIVTAGTPPELRELFYDGDELKKPSDVEDAIKRAAAPSPVLVSWEIGRFNRRAHVTIDGENGERVLIDFGATNIRKFKSSREKDAEY